MQEPKPTSQQPEARLDFFREFLKHPRQIGSIIPSSHFLKRRILEAAGVSSARTIVELGPGTGGTTRAILDAMPRHARLLSIDINPRFHALISAIADERLIPHAGNARDLVEIMAGHGLAAPDAVISGIPFSTMSQRDGALILETISSVLAPRGRFVAYQLSNRVADLCQPYMGAARIETEVRNIPPMRVYLWEKNSS